MNNEREFLDLEELLAQVEGQTLYVKEQAQLWVDNFLEQHVSGNKLSTKDKNGEKNRSLLFCRCRTKGDSIYLEWYFNFWRKGKRGKPLASYIKHPERGHSYTIEVLLKHSAPWEYEIVKRTELAFMSLRKRNFHLAKSRFQLREALKAELTLECLNAE